jgi:large subunit ribosomal protein L4
VKLYLASQRQGTHKAKERGEVRASTRKIKRQKGTGTARAGSIASPIFRGGGRVFGPRPRDYAFKVNKKVKKLARRSALAYKLKDKQLTVIEDFVFEAPKTREMVQLKDNLKISDKKALFVMAETNHNVYLSSRNLPKTDVISVDELTTYHLMNASAVVISEKAIEVLKEYLQN